MARLKRSRVLNTSMVIREIWIHREISRVQIAKNLNLDKSTVTSIVSELIEGGIVTETSTGTASRSGGRRPVMLRLNSSTASVLGIELKPDGYSAVALDLEGRITGSWNGSAEINGRNLREVFLNTVSEIRAGSTWKAPLRGIGVGISGVVNPDSGIILYSIPLHINRAWDFQKQVASTLDVPVYIENDANAFAWAELAFERTRPGRNFMCVIFEFREVGKLKDPQEGTGVGFGVVIDGKVYHGKSYSAGEFRSIFRTPANSGQFSLSREEALRITRDPKVLARASEELAKHLALFVNTFNLEELFLGGDIEQFRDSITPLIQREILANWAYPNKVRCRVRYSSFGRQAVAYGAAGMVLNRMFSGMGTPARFVPASPLFPPERHRPVALGSIGFSAPQ